MAVGFLIGTTRIGSGANFQPVTELQLPKRYCRETLWKCKIVFKSLKGFTDQHGISPIVIVLRKG